MLPSKCSICTILISLNLICGSASLAEEELHATADSLSPPPMTSAPLKHSPGSTESMNRPIPRASSNAPHSSSSAFTQKNSTGFVFETPKIDTPIIQPPHKGRVESGLEQVQPVQQYNGSQLVAPDNLNSRFGSKPTDLTKSTIDAATSSMTDLKSAASVRFDQMLQGNTQLVLNNNDYRNSSIGSGNSLARRLDLTAGHSDWGKYWEGNLVVQSCQEVAEPVGALVPYDIAADVELFPPGLTGQFYVMFDAFRDNLTINPPMAYFARASGEKSCWVWSDISEPMSDIIFHVVINKIIKDDVEQLAPNMVQQHLLSRETHSCPGYSDICYTEDMFRYTRTGNVLHVEIISLTFDESKRLVSRLVCRGELSPGQSRSPEFYTNPAPLLAGGVHRIRPNSPGNITRVDKL